MAKPLSTSAQAHPTEAQAAGVQRLRPELPLCRIELLPLSISAKYSFLRYRSRKKERPAEVSAIAGPVPVQLRFSTGLSSEEYVTRQGWREASLPCCPLHSKGGCGFARHGSYERVHPPGTRIARWYCPQGHCTFSLLPDHLAARFPGTLGEIEQVVAEVDQARSLEAAADRLRPDPITLTSALRWTRRRVRLVRTAFTRLVGLFPKHLLGCALTVDAFRIRLACASVLVHLRDMAHVYLHALPRPLGFVPPHALGGERKAYRQHRVGPDPPTHRG